MSIIDRLLGRKEKDSTPVEEKTTIKKKRKITVSYCLNTDRWDGWTEKEYFPKPRYTSYSEPTHFVVCTKCEQQPPHMGWKDNIPILPKFCPYCGDKKVRKKPKKIKPYKTDVKRFVSIYNVYE